MPKITLMGSLTVPCDDLKAVVRALPAHVEATRAEPGCLEFRVVQRSDNARVFDVYEEFTGREAFDAHQARTQASQWSRISANALRDFSLSEDDGE